MVNTTVFEDQGIMPPRTDLEVATAADLDGHVKSLESPFLSFDRLRLGLAG